MPHFENSCNVTHCDRKLTKEELIRGIRFNIAAEYEAIQLYEQIKEWLFELGINISENSYESGYEQG